MMQRDVQLKVELMDVVEKLKKAGYCTVKKDGEIVVVVKVLLGYDVVSDLTLREIIEWHVCMAMYPFNPDVVGFVKKHLPLKDL